jgi:hypothetical protein
LPLLNIAHKQPQLISCCPTSLAELETSHAKMFHTNIYFVKRCGESSPHQPGYKGLAGWFDITIEIDAYHEYSWLVRLVSLWFVFLNVYVTLILNSNWPSDVSSHPLLMSTTSMVIPRVFWHQNFVAERHTKVAIHSLSPPPSLSLR